MAGNYWDSTQAKYWTFSKAELVDIRRDLEKVNQPACSKFTMPDRRLMSIYLQSQMKKLGSRLNLRQQALATAQVYVKRFYLKVEMRRTNPYLIMATAVYLACKMEECPQHIRLMLGEAVRQFPEIGVTEASKIGECEFALISTLSSRLICHHAYRPLFEYCPMFGLSKEETHLASCMVNDSYNTDLCLLYPPHVLAVTTIFLALVFNKPGSSTGSSTLIAYQSSTPTSSPTTMTSSSANGLFSPSGGGPSAQQMMQGLPNLAHARPKLAKLVEWVAESNIDMSAIVDAAQEFISLYEVWENYQERPCKEAITRFMKEGSGLGPK